MSNEVHILFCWWTLWRIECVYNFRKIQCRAHYNLHYPHKAKINNNICCYAFYLLVWCALSPLYFTIFDNFRFFLSYGLYYCSRNILCLFPSMLSAYAIEHRCWVRPDVCHNNSELKFQSTFYDLTVSNKQNPPLYLSPTLSFSLSLC